MGVSTRRTVWDGSHAPDMVDDDRHDGRMMVETMFSFNGIKDGLRLCGEDGRFGPGDLMTGRHSGIDFWLGRATIRSKWPVHPA